MGDRSAVEIRLYGVAGHEEKVAELARAGDWQLEWGSYGPPVLTEDVREGIALMDDERSVGTLHEDDIFEELENLGVSYEATQDAKYEWSADERMFTPELGVFTSESLGEGGVAIAAHELDKLVDEAEAILTDVKRTDEAVIQLAGVFVKLNKMTGRAHRKAIEALRNAAYEAEKALAS